MLPDPITYSINSLADVSRNIPVMVFAFAKNLNTARKGVFTALLVEYGFLVLCSTVIYRTITADYNIELNLIYDFCRELYAIGKYAYDY